MFLMLIKFVSSSFYYSASTIYYLFWTVHTVLPFGLDVGILGVAAYYMTSLKEPDREHVHSIFGPDPVSAEAEQHPERVIRCIAHRGAGLDAPENTLEALKYCVERDIKFVEIDVRSCRDGKLVLLHDKGLERVANSVNVTDVHTLDWSSIRDIDVGAKHPNRQHFKEVRLCLLDEAVDYLLANRIRMIIDVKGEDREVIDGIVKIYATRPDLYSYAAVTCFNPITLYKIRKQDPRIVGCISYRPYCFSSKEYDADHGPTNPRFADNAALQMVAVAADALHALLWRRSAIWCSASAVCLHKDMVSASEVQYWRSVGVRCVGWCVNRPLEKLYWRGVLKAPYLANTLLGEPDINLKTKEPSKERESDIDIDKREDRSEQKLTTGEN